jgi:hypothetical protein
VAIAANNTVDMQTATTDLNGALQRMGEVVYSQAASPEEGAQGSDDGSATGGQEGGPEGGADDSSDDEGTVEGEFREV